METKDILFPAVATVLVFLLLRTRHKARLEFLREYRFHPMLARKVKDKYPHLSDSDVKMVFEALKDYFHLCNMAGKNMVAMPSQVVDVAWHEFILTTRSYKAFCQKAIGRFLHHTPTEVMKTPTLAQEGIKRAWRLACEKELINPLTPSRMPLLFAIDGLLNIPDGYRYTLDCKKGDDRGFCAGDIGCSSGCAGDSGTSGDGTHGCGGNSCSGGCGGD